MIFLFLLIAEAVSIPPDPCVWNPFSPGCLGLRPLSEFSMMDACMYKNYYYMFNRFCEYCANHKDEQKCQSTAKIGEKTRTCFLSEIDTSCGFCKQNPTDPDCLGFPVIEIPPDSGELVKECIRNPTNMRVCDYCSNDVSEDHKCDKPADIGSYTWGCFVSRIMTECNACLKDPSNGDCEGFPASRLETNVGETLKDCIFDPIGNSAACDFCRKHTNETVCQRPDDIGELAVRCVLFEKPKACIACNLRPEHRACNGYTAPPNSAFGRVQRLCFFNLDWSACNFCLGKSNIPDCMGASRNLKREEKPDGKRLQLRIKRARVDDKEQESFLSVV